MIRILNIGEDNRLSRYFLSNKSILVKNVINMHEIINELKNCLYDVIVIDEFSNFSVNLKLIKYIRFKDTNNTIIITLLNENSLLNTLNALEFGSDDCVVKSFNYVELENRIKNHLNSIGKIKLRKTEKIIRKIKLNKESLVVNINNKYTKLSKKEFLLFSLLLNNNGNILSKDTILKTIWSDDYSKSIVRVYINRLKKKFNELEFKSIKKKGFVLELT